MNVGTLIIEESMALKTSPSPPTARIRCRLPLFRAWEDVIRIDDDVLIFEHVWATAGRWRVYLATTSGDGWRVERIGPFVMAHRVLI